MEPVQLSAVHPWHVDAGARMMVAGPWMRPEHYGDPTEEVRAVRETVGLIDVSPLGKLKLTGPGVATMLERLYVNQWQDLGRGRVRYGIMCNDEGVILDDGVCARLSDNEWYVSTTSTGASGAFEWMEWWRQSGWGEGVHITDLTETHAAFNLTGPLARHVLQPLTSRDLSHRKFPYMRARRTQVAGVECLLLRIGFTGELGYEIHCPAGYGPYLWETLVEAGAAHGLRPFGVEAQRILRLEKAHFIVGQDTDALTDPLSADAPWAVHLDKEEDFLGRRALNRISEEGPKQRLVGFRTGRRADRIIEGLQIVQQNDRGAPTIIGWISSCRYSPTLQETLGLCWLPAELAAQEGATFHIHVEGQLEQATVHHGPFYDPEGKRVRG
jgi:sarcosine oxidase subunit alpha